MKGTVTENQKRDHALYFVEEGEVGFSPERNKAIVEGTIKKYEIKRRRQIAAFRDQVAERSDAVATYLQHVAQGGDDNIDKYFGKKELSRLRGEDKLAKLKRMYGVN